MNRIAILEGYDSTPFGAPQRVRWPPRAPSAYGAGLAPVGKDEAAEKCMTACLKKYVKRAAGAKRRKRKATPKQKRAQNKLARAAKACRGKHGAAFTKCVARRVKKGKR